MLKIYRVQRLYPAAYLGLAMLLMLGFFFADEMFYALGMAWAFSLCVIDSVGQRQFATISDDGILTIYGLFHRIRWQQRIDETQFAYQRSTFIQNEERHYLLLQHTFTQQSKKITLNRCQYKGFGLLMDLNDLAATPFFQKIDQNCHSESLNWKNAQKQR